MNYLILSNKNEWNEAIQNVFPNQFLKEVTDDKQRIDFVFGDFVTELLETEDSESEYGNQLSRVTKLLSAGGVTTAVFEIPQDLLYQESNKFREKLLGFFSKDYYRFEIRGFNLQAFGLKTAVYRYFIFIYPRITTSFLFNSDEGLTYNKKEIDFDQQNLFKDDEIIYINIFKSILQKIKENILGIKNDE